MNPSVKVALVAAPLGLATVASVAYAAALTVSSSSIAAGTSVVAACQTSGPLTPTYTTSDTNGLGYKITAVNLAGIDAACVGKTVSVTISNGASSILASGSLVVAGAAAVVPVSPSILASAVTALSIQIL